MQHIHNHGIRISGSSSRQIPEGYAVGVELRGGSDEERAVLGRPLQYELCLGPRKTAVKPREELPPTLILHPRTLQRQHNIIRGATNTPLFPYFVKCRGCESAKSKTPRYTACNRCFLYVETVQSFSPALPCPISSHTGMSGTVSVISSPSLVVRAVH